jgi:hypothetical protein
LANGELPTWLSGWTVAWRYLNPFAQQIGMPNIMSILMRSVTATSHGLMKAEVAAKLTAVYLRPPVDTWNIMDFSSASAISDQGYKGTLKELKAWWTRAGDAIMGRTPTKPSAAAEATAP